MRPVASVCSRSSISARTTSRLDLRPAARRVRADQRALQRRAGVRRDVPGRERAEPGRDAVRRDRRGRQRVDPSARGGHRRERLPPSDRTAAPPRATATTSAAPSGGGPTSTGGALTVTRSSNTARGDGTGQEPVPRRQCGVVGPRGRPRVPRLVATPEESMFRHRPPPPSPPRRSPSPSPCPPVRAAPAKPARHFLTTQEFPGPPGYYEWGGAKAKKLKPVGLLGARPDRGRRRRTGCTSPRNSPGSAPTPSRAVASPARRRRRHAAVAFGVQYIAITKNAAAAERLVTAIKDRLKVCANNDVGTPKHPKKTKYLSFGDQPDGDRIADPRHLPLVREDEEEARPRGRRRLRHRPRRPPRHRRQPHLDPRGLGPRPAGAPPRSSRTFVPTAKAGVAKLPVRRRHACTSTQPARLALDGRTQAATVLR